MNALRELIDDESAEAILRDGQQLETLVSGSITTYCFLYKHPREVNGVSASDLILVEANPSGQFVGFGDVSYVEGDISPAVLNKPYVAYILTAKEAQGQGLGLQRLRSMNNLSKTWFGHELHSDPSSDTEPEARSLWFKLIESGEARSYEENGGPRYCFI